MKWVLYERMLFESPSICFIFFNEKLQGGEGLFSPHLDTSGSLG